MRDSARLGQAAPLSVNCAKKAVAVCFVGVSTHRHTTTGTKAKTWTRAKMPSASGKRFAANTLKAAMPRTDAMVSKVPCHLDSV